MRRHPFLRIIWFFVKVTALIGGANWAITNIDAFSKKKSLAKGNFYPWTYGRIFYTKRGSGTPILLLHGLDMADSSAKVDTLSKALAATHTVYSVDLLGYGRSDKPWITYTNFIYVLMINDFINDVIKEKTSIVACEGSGLLAMQAHKNFPEAINKAIIINPSTSDKVKAPGFLGVFLRKFIEIPVYGTFYYNIKSLIHTGMADRDCKHVYASRVCGCLTEDISGRTDLLSPDVIKINPQHEAGMTFGRIIDELNK